MEITKRTLAEAWQRAAARHALLAGVGLPPVTYSEDELEEWAERAEEAGEGGLFLLLDEDGTVHGRHGPYQEAFATRDLEQVLYLIAEAAMRERGGVLGEVADALGRIDPGWGRRFRAGGLDDPGTLEACGRDPLEGLAWTPGPGVSRLRTRRWPSSARRPGEPSTPSGSPCSTGPIPRRSRPVHA
ncbi:hypothetical protein [Streptomyces atroolivaceus]|uniref:hypothetical protein n=1 Tax=Streptomyces atroolivaceus TaxID=66869 RepID=UPI0036B875FB